MSRRARSAGPFMSAEREAIIRVENFTAAYNGQVVLEDVNFEVFTGEIFFILGSSGSGKSTLLKHMIGLYQPAAGRIIIEGHDIAAAQGEERREILRTFGVMIVLEPKFRIAFTG